MVAGKNGSGASSAVGVSADCPLPRELGSLASVSAISAPDRDVYARSWLEVG